MKIATTNLLFTHDEDNKDEDETLKFAIYQGGGDLIVQAYTDTSFSYDLDDSKSTSEYIFLLGGGVVSWSNKKQTLQSVLYMESEYVASSTITL